MQKILMKHNQPMYTCKGRGKKSNFKLLLLATSAEMYNMGQKISQELNILKCS